MLSLIIHVCEAYHNKLYLALRVKLGINRIVCVVHLVRTEALAGIQLLLESNAMDVPLITVMLSQ